MDHRVSEMRGLVSTSNRFKDDSDGTVDVEVEGPSGVLWTVALSI